MTHEKSCNKQVDDYFTRKFAPAVPFYQVGRSYRAKPTCDPACTLFDAWKELPACWDRSGSGDEREWW